MNNFCSIVAIDRYNYYINGTATEYFESFKTKVDEFISQGYKLYKVNQERGVIYLIKIAQ